ncbi:MAG: flagellar basal body rod protein FlgB [Gammaproteobacteria bacterium]
MAIGFDAALGNLDDSLKVYSKRTEILASNLANTDTPGYKARDIDFRQALSRADNHQNIKLATTNKAHLSGSNSGMNTMETLYRTPLQPSLDGNTVDSHIEQQEFTQNAIRYQSTLTFLTGRIRGLKTALNGE